MTVPHFFEVYEPVQYNNIEKCTLKELDDYLDVKLDEVLNSEGCVYVQAQTASGKTERIIRNYDKLFKADLLGKQIYAVPTHMLAKEFEDRLKAYNPNIPVYRVPPGDYSDTDLMLMSMGLPSNYHDKERSETLKKLFDETMGVFIITHSLLINLAERLKPTRIIIDENIEEALITNIDITPGELAGIGIYLDSKTRNRINDFVDALREMPYGAVIYTTLFDDITRKLKPLVETEAEALSRVVPNNFFNIVNADELRVSALDDGTPIVRGFSKSKLITNALDTNTPIKLFTATPMNTMLSKYYGRDFEVVKAPLAANTGKVIQYCNTTGAKYKIESHEAAVREKLSEEQIRNSVLLTFKNGQGYYSKDFNIAKINDEQVHLMNNAGLDFLKGKDLIVVGKFDKNPKCYKDM